MADWSGFFVAQAGASAALTGLIFVAVSLNLTKIVSYARLPDRALEALALLLGILVASSLVLVPDQPLQLLGVEVLAVGIVLWGIVTTVTIRGLLVDRRYRRQNLIRAVMVQVATIPLVIGGVAVLLAGRGGLYWIVPAFIFSYLVALTEGWVLLIEINR